MSSNSSTTTTTTTTPVPIIDDDEGYSGGTVFCVLFLVGCLCYLGGGILVRKILRGAEGVELIPHFQFWTELPGLIRDGILFTVRGCKVDMNYERI